MQWVELWEDPNKATSKITLLPVMDAKQKAVDKTLQRLTPTFQKKLNGFDVCVELYGRGQLTFSEYQEIQSLSDVHAANKKLVSALLRRGPDILEILLEALAEEEEANKHIIDKIKDGTSLAGSLLHT